LVDWLEKRPHQKSAFLPRQIHRFNLRKRCHRISHPRNESFILKKSQHLTHAESNQCKVLRHLLSFYSISSSVMAHQLESFWNWTTLKKWNWKIRGWFLGKVHTPRVRRWACSESLVKIRVWSSSQKFCVSLIIRNFDSLKSLYQHAADAKQMKFFRLVAKFYAQIAIAIF
jgi:hypothetical protein